jgi:hypothetical protein
VSTSEPNPFAPAFSAPPPQAARPRATVGQRVAGGLLVANALLALTIGAFGPHTLPPAATITLAVIDLGIGASLLAGSRKLVPWATARAAIGLVVLTALNWQSPLTAALQVLVTGSLLLFLLGDAGAPRIAIGSSLFGLYALVSVGSLAGDSLGTGLRTALIMLSGTVEQAPAQVVTGVAYPYTLTFPGDRWHLRKADVVKKDQPLADRWATRPDEDAHVLTIVELVPGKVLFLDPYADAVLEGQRKASTDFVLVDRGPLESDPESGRFLHVTFHSHDLDFERYTAVVSTGDRGFQIIATAERSKFPRLAAELRGILNSFHVPPEALLPPASAEVEDAPAGEVVGVSYPYRVTAPNDRWYIRKSEAAKKDQPLADRWLTRPDRGAHVIIVAEHVPGAKLPIEAYVDEVLKSVKKGASAFDLVAREPLPADPTRGRFLHTTISREDLSFEYYYGLFTAGDRAFQIIGFTERAGFAVAAPEIRRIIDSFRLPAP